MPVFEYTALNQKGKTVNGVIDADSLVAARQKLRNLGKYPVDVDEVAETTQKKRVFSPVFSGKIKREEVLVITRQLATLLGAGIPLIASLDALIEQTANVQLKKILTQVKNSVFEGNSLTSALSPYPKLFPDVYVNMVKAGEASGALDIVLSRLADYEEHQRQLVSRFKSALIYPIFMCIVGVMVMSGLFVFVIPSITEIFLEMGQVLPLPTRILIQASDILTTWWWAFAGTAVAALFALFQVVQRPAGRREWDKWKLKLPGLGGLNQKLFLARFSRTLAGLLGSGVGLLASLQIVRNIVNNVLVEEVIDGACDEIKKGKSMHESLRDNRFFPTMVIQMISVGERSGSLETMLQKIADAYENELEARVAAISSLIEPTMILLMGAVIGFIVVSVLLPIFEMNQIIS